MTVLLENKDNIEAMESYLDRAFKVQIIYGDCIYDDFLFKWANSCRDLLDDGGVFLLQTDYHTVAHWKLYLDALFGKQNFINWLVWKNEWGNHPKNKFHQCYDDILIYSKGKNYKFYSDRIQVPKATANTKLNPSGRMTKTATAWIDDVTLTTTSKERAKKKDGHLLRWQKPEKLFDRIILPFCEEYDWVLDPFMGSGSLGIWSMKNNRNFIGIEQDPEVFSIAKARIFPS